MKEYANLVILRQNGLSILLKTILLRSFDKEGNQHNMIDFKNRQNELIIALVKYLSNKKNFLRNSNDFMTHEKHYSLLGLCLKTSLFEELLSNRDLIKQLDLPDLYFTILKDFCYRKNIYALLNDINKNEVVKLLKQVQPYYSFDTLLPKLLEFEIDLDIKNYNVFIEEDEEYQSLSLLSIMDLVYPRKDIINGIKYFFKQKSMPYTSTLLHWLKADDLFKLTTSELA